MRKVLVPADAEAITQGASSVEDVAMVALMSAIRRAV